MKAMRPMSVFALLLLCACTDASVLNDIKKQSDQDARAEEDPSLYVISAIVAMSYDQAKSGTFSANWEDGEGTVELGSENRSTVLRRTSSAAPSSEGYSFDFTYNGASYSSGDLSLRECEDLAKSLGYDASAFRRMSVSFNFGFESSAGDEVPIPIKEGEPLPPPAPPPQLKLVRAPEASGGQDAKAVTCRTASPSGKRLLRISVQGKVSEAWRLLREDKSLISPGTLELESFPFERAKQTFLFAFDRSSDIEKNQIPILVQTPQGEKPFTASFNACTSLDKSGYGDPSRVNKLISEDISIFLDDKGEVQEGASRTCCYSTGSCTALTP